MLKALGKWSHQSHTLEQTLILGTLNNGSPSKNCVRFFVGDQTQTSPRPNHDRDWITQPGMLIHQKLLEQWCTGNVTDNVFFVVYNIFFFGFFISFCSFCSHCVFLQVYGMRWCCRFHFRNVTNNIVFSLQVYIGRSDGH